ncbi:MAG: hypothetical protein GF329_00380 [Candidatus Lokiarchaeota archaeon]|nr:hypothetical protein [Candidatus Lokiarchaeota archaeon]
MGRKRFMKIKIGNKTFNINYKGFNPNLNNFESVEKIYKDYERNFKDNTFPKHSRSYSFLKEVIRKDPHLRISADFLYIRSLNKRRYKINLKTKEVFSKNHFCCVQIDHKIKKELDDFDIIIAKALTIAYAPEKISTIWK